MLSLLSITLFRGRISVLKRWAQSTAQRLLFFIAALASLFSGLACASDTSSLWLNGTGNWNDPTQWSTNPVFPNNGTLNYSVTASAGTLTLNQAITIDQFTLSYNPPASNPPPNVTLQGGKTLTVNSAFNWNTGTISGSGILISAGTTTLSGTNNLNGWTLNLAGTTSLSGQIYMSSNSIINNQAGATLTGISHLTRCSRSRSGFPSVFAMLLPRLAVGKSFPPPKR